MHKVTPEHWTDEPQSSEGDTLGRKPYATAAAQLIVGAHSFEASVVFGLSGPWGSGKTSLVNMIVDEIKHTHPDWAIARFTPWATSSVDDLITEFYASITAALPEEKAQPFRNAILKISRVAAPLAKRIPLAGDIGEQAVTAVLDHFTAPQPWQVVFREAAEALHEIKKPILVVVDDIDRLHHEELMTLMKVVRLLGRFNGTQYLLAYDDETLYQSMRSAGVVGTSDGTAERFMEKIVQYPLRVPPLLEHQLTTRLNEGISALTRIATQDGNARLGGLRSAFTSLLTTPRAIERYLAQLAHHIPLVPADEIDDQDVYLLTLIRVALPSLYNALPQHKLGLTEGRTARISADAKTHEPFNVERLLDLAPHARETARDLLQSLFPKASSDDWYTFYPSEHPQSVCYGEYFDRYFFMGLPDNDISDVEIAKAIQAAIDGNPDPLVQTVIEADDEKQQLILRKATALNIPSATPYQQNLVRALTQLANALPPINDAPFTTLDEVLRWIASIISTDDGYADNEHAAADVIELMALLRDAELRVRVWNRVSNEIQRRYRRDTPHWFTQATDWVVATTVESVLEHLLQGDAAPENSFVGLQIQFVLNNDSNALRPRIDTLIDELKLNLATVASRCISMVKGDSSPKWSLSNDVQQGTFNQLAPPRSDPWYHKPVDPSIDPLDTTWANRRRFAEGRFEPPAEEVF